MYHQRAVMSSILTRFSRHVSTLVVRQKTHLLFTKYLLLTNTTITVILSGTGDLMQQYYQHLQDNRVRWDPIRTKNICLAGLVLGPVCHFWYLYLDRFLPGRSLSVILKKVLADQVVVSPVCVISFLVVLGYSEGVTKAQLKRDLLDKGPPLLKAEWLIWPPAQFVNFAFLPTRYRVLYDNTISLGFDNYYSYVKYRRDSANCDTLDEGSSVDIEVTEDYYLPEETFIDFSSQTTNARPIDLVPHYGNICGSYYSHHVCS
jgi:protein Mpv17